MRPLTLVSGVCCAVAGAAILMSPNMASAQASPEELVVTGRYGTAPDSVRSLSQAVSYADLDLGTEAGKNEIRHRLKLTARYLCEKMGETDTTSTGPTPSCRDAAVKDAMDRLGTLEGHFAPRGTTWVSGTAWQPPYSRDWANKYP